MKSSSQLIAEQVFSVNAFYTKKQNETKELFFKCLEENKGLDYFSNELNKIWDNIDHRFMDKQIAKLKNLVHSNNVEEFLDLSRFDSDTRKALEETYNWVIDNEFFKLTPEEEFRRFEQKFKANVEKNYKSSKKALKGDSTEQKKAYLDKKIDTYNRQVNQVITYFAQPKNRHVQLSSYLSMVHNTNLTRSGWNQTMGDSEKLGKEMFIIPYHPFSCHYCVAHQNKPLTKSQVEKIIGTDAKEQQGDILHPNCKCTLSIYWDSSQISNRVISEAQAEEEYKLRQKVNTLTLEKTNLRTDMKIAEELGDQSRADDCRKRINAINRTIRDIKAELPTEELQKQITAINR